MRPKNSRPTDEKQAQEAQKRAKKEEAWRVEK
jgi:hypothetical protein